MKDVLIERRDLNLDVNQKGLFNFEFKIKLLLPDVSENWFICNTRLLARLRKKQRTTR